MLVNIGSKHAPRAPRDALGLLVECHGRIRSFMDLARRLAEDLDAEPVLRAEAARSIHRYFAMALPLHVLDEDTSLLPRLWQVADDTVKDAVVEMADQHGEIEETIADLLPEWADVALSGRRMSPYFARETEALDLMWAVHLELEESVVFPAAARLLSPADLTSIADEIRDRRKPETFQAAVSTKGASS